MADREALSAEQAVPAGPRARWLTRAVSLALPVGAWGVVAHVLHSPDLPGPVAVAGFLLKVGASGELLRHLTLTLTRVGSAFACAMLVGAVIGIALGRFPRLNLAFDGPLLILLNLPALVIAVLAYVWLGLTDLAAVIAVALNKIPMVAITLREGARALDPSLDDMAKVYRLPLRTRLVHVILPALAPFLAAAARNGLSMVWKIVLFVELLGRPNGVGHVIHTAFQLYDLTAVIGWSLAFVAVMLIIEYAIMEPVERYVSRWRRL